MTYLWLKLPHLAVVVLFLGNITTGLFWVHRIKHRNSPAALADAMDGIIGSDRMLRRWDILGAASLIPAWLALVLMVLKIPA